MTLLLLKIYFLYYSLIPTDVNSLIIQVIDVQNYFNIIDNTSDITDKYIFLEWKQTRKRDWDWFKTEINLLYLKCLKDNITNNKICIDFENVKKLKNKQFRDEILEQINIISSKYTNETNKIVLASRISNILDKFEI